MRQRARVNRIALANGRWPALPVVVVEDASGKVVYKSRLKHGRGLICSRGWRVPEGLQGEFVAKVKYCTDPFEIVLKETKFTVD